MTKRKGSRLAQHWFLLSLAAVLAIGFLAPQPFERWTKWSPLRNGVVAGVLFLMALPLETRVVWRTLRRPWAALLGSLLNMGLVPLIAWVGAQALRGDMALGVIVAATAPCTLASAAVWTRRAGGNDAAAILVTVLTNATCFLTTPFWLVRLTQTETMLDVGPMIRDLALLVVLPMACAQLLRLWPPIARWATRSKIACSTIAQFGILWMVLTGAVTCSSHLGATDWSHKVAWPEFAGMVATTTAIHLVALGGGYFMAHVARLSRDDCIAVALAGSQKTLMVGLYIAINYFGGLTILPMISYHVGQLFLDTLIADHWAQETRRVAPD
jgi:sodium/bile acid cotransporter 7